MPMTVESLISSMEWAASNKLDEYAFVHDGDRVTFLRGSHAAGFAAPSCDAAVDVGAGTNALEDAVGLVAIEAPLAGIVHLAQDPGSAPFVAVGGRVTKGQTVCVVEAMKVMSSIGADTDGTVAEICVEDGSSVEAGASLVKVHA